MTSWFRGCQWLHSGQLQFCSSCFHFYSLRLHLKTCLSYLWIPRLYRACSGFWYSCHLCYFWTSVSNYWGSFGGYATLNPPSLSSRCPSKLAAHASSHRRCFLLGVSALFSFLFLKLRSVQIPETVEYYWGFLVLRPVLVSVLSPLLLLLSLKWGHSSRLPSQSFLDSSTFRVQVCASSSQSPSPPLSCNGSLLYLVVTRDCPPGSLFSSVALPVLTSSHSFHFRYG